MKYTYTAEIESDEDIYTVKEFIDECVNVAVDEVIRSEIKEGAESSGEAVDGAGV